MSTAENIRPMREGFVEQDEVKVPRAAPPPHMEDPPPPPEERSAADFLKAEKWPVVVKLLHKQITNNNGEMINQLEFRQPRGGDINRYGNPCRINQEGDVVIDERKMHYVMAALCGVLPPMLEAMDPRDWNSCAYRLRDFFCRICGPGSRTERRRGNDPRLLSPGRALQTASGCFSGDAARRCKAACVSHGAAHRAPRAQSQG